MSRIKLYNLEIENFKGIKRFGLCLDGDNATITAENGIGKTTIYDAFLWLLFGKDSTGRKDFEVRPLDRHNQPIKGVVLAVEADLDIDGVRQTFRKEHHEKVVKGQLRGYETLCWINEVPRKVGDYAEYIAAIISEETFKLLTDLHFFNSKLHWTDRRKVLLAIAGEIGTPDGFDELLAALNNRTVDEYKKVLSEQKKRHVKERDEINPRIDEILKGLEHPASDTEELGKRREELKYEIEKLIVLRKEVNAQEARRQNSISKVATLKERKVIREAELKTDTSGVDALLEEKTQIGVDIAKAAQLVGIAENELNVATAKKTAVENAQESLLASLNTIRDEYKMADTNIGPSVCYACGGKLPKDKLVLNEEKRQARLNEITVRGDELKRNVDENKRLLAALDDNINIFTETLKKVTSGSQKTHKEAGKRFTEIDEAIKTRPTTPPEQDEAWQKIVAEIAKVEKEIGPPIAEQLEAIESERTTKETELTKLNEELAQADRMVKDRARIEELEAKEKELAQKIADIAKQLKDIENYETAESKLIEHSVNSHFKVVEFKLFDELLTLELDEDDGKMKPKRIQCCEAIYKGIPYPDMSFGQQIYCGIDEINVLSEHYKVWAPLFIDHSESMTMPIEAHSQTIELMAKNSYTERVATTEGIKEIFHDYSKLQVETKNKVEKAVA